jgi:pilus assembly protein Flp/PilA
METSGSVNRNVGIEWLGADDQPRFGGATMPAAADTVFLVPNRKAKEAMSEFLQRFRDDPKGVTAVEYGLITAFIALVIIAAVSLLGTNMSSIFSKVATTL